MDENLEQIAKVFNAERGFEKKLTEYKILTITNFCKGHRALDLGCGVGLITKALSERFDKVVGVDGSRVKIERAKQIVQRPNVEFHVSMFEDFIPKGKFDTIVLSNVLEHVDAPISLLKRIRQWVNPRGVAIVTVPNCRSLHKRVGKAMGLISDLYELTELDLVKGHKRMYDMNLLREHFEFAGFKVIEIGGIFLKPLSNKQMESWDSAICDAFYEVGKELPDYCSGLYAIGGLQVPTRKKNE